jgi:tetratricopeptide (TPR) repeat protein
MSQPKKILKKSYMKVNLSPSPSSIAHSERGAAHALLGSYARALEDFDVAIAIDPSNAAAHSSRGNILMAAHQLDDALLCYDQAIALDPSDAVPVWNKSCALLKQGDLSGGWQLFESRWSAEQSIRRDFPQPLWLGRESITGKTILLHAEQGLGDTLQFCRYVTRVLELGARVALEVPKPLVRLMQDSFQRPFLAGADRRRRLHSRRRRRLERSRRRLGICRHQDSSSRAAR